MARRATIITQKRAAATGPVLLLDAGGSLMGERLSYESDGKVTVEAMNLMGYDAMAIGYRDMQKGLDVLLARQQEAQFPFVSCNIVDRATGQPLFDPYIVIERGGVRFGILGISETDTVELPEVREKLAALDPITATAAYLPELRTQSDLVILLSHVGMVNERWIAHDNPGMIDLIVGGLSREVSQAVEREGETMIVHAGFNGEWLGIFQGTWEAQGRWSNVEGMSYTLGPEVADDPALAGLVQSYGQRYPTPTSSLDPRYLTPAAELSPSPTAQQPAPAATNAIAPPSTVVGAAYPAPATATPAGAAYPGPTTQP